MTGRTSGVALLLASTLMAGAAEAQITLEQAMVRAYAGNPTLLADREGLKVLDEDVATARSGGRPTLVGEANLTRSEIDVTGTGGIYGARLTQPLYRGSRIRNNVNAAETNVLAGRESLRQSEIDILLGVVDAYSAVLRDQEILELNRNMVQILDGVRAAEQRRLDLGERTKTDVSQAQARLSGVLASVSVAERRLAESRARFRSIVGDDADQLVPLPPLPQMPSSRDDAVAIAEDNSPRLLQAKHAMKVSDYQLKSAKGALLPSLDASAAVNHRNEIVQILGRKVNQDLATFQLVLTVPLFQGGAEYAAVRRAKHTREVRMHEIDEASREVMADVSVAWDRLVTARVAEAAYVEATKANEVAVAGVRREALGGTRTTLDILDAERELRDAKIAHVTAAHEEYIAGFRLIAAMGKATAADLNLPVDRYDPAAHYRRAAGRWIGFEP